MAIITAPYAYTANLILPRHRQPKEMRLRADLEIEVRALTTDEAPVAIRYKNELRNLPPHELRWDGERLLRPLLDPIGYPLTVAAYEKELQETRERQWDAFPFPRIQKVKQPYGPAKPENVLKLERASNVAVREFLGSDQHEQQAICAAIGTEMALIDGLIYVQAIEPVLRISGDPEWLRLEFEVEVPVPNHSAITFRADRKAEAVELVKTQCANPSIGLRSAEVLMPEVLGFNEVASNAREMIDMTLPRIADAIGSLASVEAMRAWCDLTELADSWKGDDEGAKVVLEAAATFFGHDLSPRDNRVSTRGTPKIYREDAIDPSDVLFLQAAYVDHVLRPNPEMDGQLDADLAGMTMAV